MMEINHPTKAGQKFTSPFTMGKETVQGFFSQSGILYETYRDCKSKNPEGANVIVKIKEKGSVELKYCTLVED